MQMTGTWERRLRTLADGVDWTMPAADALNTTLSSINPVLRDAAIDPGITGKSADAASESFHASLTAAAQLKTALATVSAGIEQANGARAQARQAIDALPPGDIGAAFVAVIGAATPGTVLFSGAFSVIAGPVATGAANLWLSGQREAAAKGAVDTVGLQMAPPAPLNLPGQWSDPGAVDIYVPTPPGSGGVIPHHYPDTNDTSRSLVPSHPSIIDHTPQTGDGTWTGAPGAAGSALFGSGYIAPVLTADGPIASGVATLSGAPRGGLLGVLSSGAAGAGSAGFYSGNGLAAGVGGAAALGAGSLLSKSGLRGLGGGVSGGAGLRGAAGGRVAGGGSGPGGTGASSRGGMLGSQGAVEARSASAGASSEGAAGGGRSMPGMMGGGGQGGSGEKKSAGTGLGGLIAPKLDDDAELGPRSAAAGAGGRD
jgi:hypothetical protein